MSRLRGVRRQVDDRGAAAVEFALVWTFVLSPIIYLLIAFGFVMNQQITASQLAREAARAAAICSSSSGATATSCNTEGANRFGSAKTAGFNGTVVVDSSRCFGASPTDATATVSVSPALPIPFSLTIKGKATTPCGG